MTDQFKFACRVFASLSVIAALAFGTAAAGYAQGLELQNGDPEGALYRDHNGALYAPSAGERQERQGLPAAMRASIAQTGTPCGGDFGMMEGLEAERHGVADANPCDAPVCD